MGSLWLVQGNHMTPSQVWRNLTVTENVKLVSYKKPLPMLQKNLSQFSVTCDNITKFLIMIIKNQSLLLYELPIKVNERLGPKVKTTIRLISRAWTGQNKKGFMIYLKIKS